MQARIVFITHPPDGAPAFARRLVETGVAACCNRVDASSTYRWKGEVVEEGEVLLIVKTSVQRLAELERLVREEHPYDVPEFVVLRPVSVEPKYLAWLLGAVS